MCSFPAVFSINGESKIDSASALTKVVSLPALSLVIESAAVWDIISRKGGQFLFPSVTLNIDSNIKSIVFLMVHSP